MKVIFSVTNPMNGNFRWDIRADVPFAFKCSVSPLPPCPSPAPSPSLTIDIGWNTTEYVNTGSRFDLSPVFVNSTNNRGLGAAFPIRINALTRAAQPCVSSLDCPDVLDPTRRFRVTSNPPPDMIGGVQTGAVGTGLVGMEGHPVWSLTAPTGNVPVKSVVKPFPITDTVAAPRRQIVDFRLRLLAEELHGGG